MKPGSVSLELNNHSFSILKLFFVWFQVRDIELELDEEKRRHAETIKILRKKERQVKEIIIAAEEDRKNAMVATEQVDKLSEKVKMYKRQLNETVLSK